MSLLPMALRSTACGNDCSYDGYRALVSDGGTVDIEGTWSLLAVDGDGVGWAVDGGGALLRDGEAVELPPADLHQVALVDDAAVALVGQVGQIFVLDPVSYSSTEVPGAAGADGWKLAGDAGVYAVLSVDQGEGTLIEGAGSSWTSESLGTAAWMSPHLDMWEDRIGLAWSEGSDSWSVMWRREAVWSAFDGTLVGDFDGLVHGGDGRLWFAMSGFTWEEGGEVRLFRADDCEVVVPEVVGPVALTPALNGVTVWGLDSDGVPWRLEYGGECEPSRTEAVGTALGPGFAEVLAAGSGSTAFVLGAFSLGEFEGDFARATAICPE